MRYGGSHVVDQLLADQRLKVEHAVEDLADREGCERLRPHSSQGVLILGCGAVFEPEQVEGFQGSAQNRRLVRRESVVGVMQQRKLGAEFISDGCENSRYMSQVPSGVPCFLQGQSGSLGGLVVVTLTFGLLHCHAVNLTEPRNPGLDADGLVALVEVKADRVK